MSDTRTTLMRLAEKAAEAAGSNARCAPQLLLAHILWTLEAAQADGTITVRTNPGAFNGA